MSPIMMFHVATGTISVIAGTVAIFSRKGSRLHRRAGNIFFVSMLLMAIAGAFIAFLKPMMIALLGGVFTCYLVTTSWVTIKRAEQKIGLFEYIFPFVALAVAIGGVIFGLEAMHSELGLKDGFSFEPYFFFSGLAILALSLDLNLLVRGGLSEKHRLVRHIWRMCLALYFAMGSLFTGPGAQSFPESVRGTFLLSVPENVVALLMTIWLVRVLFMRWCEGTKA